jgi:GTP:adenosylcobinamide-phosphate guanylyltransferase
MDFSLSTLIPIDEIIDNNNEVFVKELTDYYGVCNNFMCVKKNNQTLKNATEQIIDNIENEYYGDVSLSITGPIFLMGPYRQTHDNFEFTYQYIENDTVISNITGIKIIKTKIDDHYTLLYGEKSEDQFRPLTHYDSLWKNKIIYKDKRWTSIEKLYKSILNREPDLEGVVHHYSSHNSMVKIRDLFYVSEEYRNIKKVNIKRKLDVILISVNYNDFLSITLKENKKLFNNIHVITSSKDILCQKICEVYDVNCIVTDVMYEDSVFNKGKAYNYALNQINNLDYVLILDGDIIVLDDIDVNNLEERCFYYAARRLCSDYDTYKNMKNVNELMYDKPWGDGFFQLINMKDGLIYFSEDFKNCNNIDVDYREKFEMRILLKNEVIHLGEKETNWDGRVTKPFITDDEINKLINNYNDKNL